MQMPQLRFAYGDSYSWGICAYGEISFVPFMAQVQKYVC